MGEAEDAAPVTYTLCTVGWSGLRAIGRLADAVRRTLAARSEAQIAAMAPDPAEALMTLDEDFVTMTLLRGMHDAEFGGGGGGGGATSRPVVEEPPPPAAARLAGRGAATAGSAVGDRPAVAAAGSGANTAAGGPARAPPPPSRSAIP